MKNNFAQTYVLSERAILSMLTYDPGTRLGNYFAIETFLAGHVEELQSIKSLLANKFNCKMHRA